MALVAADASRAATTTTTTTGPKAGRKKLVIVEGNISAGKSTLCRQMSEELNYALFLEPTVGNPYLEKYYADPKTYGLPMQIWLLKQRFVTYCQALKYLLGKSCEADQVNGVILDRSIFSDCVFAEKNYLDENISAEGYKFYNNLRQELLSALPLPDVVVYLDASAETCYDRIHNMRGRDCEGGIPLAYLQGLDSCYNNFLDDMCSRGAQVHRLEWNTFGRSVDVSRIVRESTTKLEAYKNAANLHRLVTSPDRIRDMITVHMIPEAKGPEAEFADVADPDVLTQAECVVTPTQRLRKMPDVAPVETASDSGAAHPLASPSAADVSTPVAAGDMEPLASPTSRGSIDSAASSASHSSASPSTSASSSSKDLAEPVALDFAEATKDAQ